MFSFPLSTQDEENPSRHRDVLTFVKVMLPTSAELCLLKIVSVYLKSNHFFSICLLVDSRV